MMKKMNDLEEAGDSIEDIVKAMESLKESGFPGPYYSTFKITKELYKWWMSPEREELMKEILSMKSEDD